MSAPSTDREKASRYVELASSGGTARQDKARRAGEFPSHPFRSLFPSGNLKEAAEFRDNYLLGDWWGARSWLASHGVKPSLLLITDPFGNPTGGDNQGFGVYNLFGADVRVETEPLLDWWKGGEFHIGFAASFGKDLSNEEVGNTFPIQLAAAGAPSAERLTYLSYTQSLLDGLLSIRFGRLTLNSVYGEEFLASEYFKAFTSVAFDLVPIGPFLNASGAYGYPFTTWGARVKVEPDNRFYVMVGVYNGNSDVRDPDKHGVDFSLDGPPFIIGEVGFRWHEAAGSPKLPGNLKIGGYYNGGSQDRFDGDGSEQGLPGVYLIADQVLLRWGGSASDRHLGAFAAAAVAPNESISTMPYFLDVGFVAHGALPGRPKDFINLGVAYGRFSRDLRRAQQSDRNTDPSVVVQKDEIVVEIGYGWAALPGLMVQPDLQIIVNPGGDRSTPTALALGVNAVIKF